MHNIQEENIVEDVARGIPRIYATLYNRHAEHEANMIEVEGKINNQIMSILIGSREIHSYIAPNIVERCQLQKKE